MNAVLLISHGSHSPKTKREVVRLIKRLKSLSRIEIFECAFLEIESPSISEGIGKCVKKGATDLIILLNFLNSGRHVDEDIPRIISKAKRKYPNIKFRITSPVGQHYRIDELFVDLLKKSSE